MNSMIIRSQDKTAAKRIGVSLTEYISQLVTGNRWCSRCRSFKPVASVKQRVCKPCEAMRCRERRVRKAILRKQKED